MLPPIDKLIARMVMAHGILQVQTTRVAIELFTNSGRCRVRK